MITSIVASLIAIAGLLVLLLLAKRLIRLALKLFLAGALVLALLAVMSVGWWQGWFDHPAGTKAAPPRTSSTRRGSSH
jgi:hypothetical protein